MKLLKDCLTNGPHLGSPQQAQKVTDTHIFKEISNYFATGLLEDPVVVCVVLFSAAAEVLSVGFAVASIYKHSAGAAAAELNSL